MIIIDHLGASLAFQWLRLCTSNVVGVGSILSQGTKTPHTGTSPAPKNN